jgi:hypothetical protein
VALSEVLQPRRRHGERRDLASSSPCRALPQSRVPVRRGIALRNYLQPGIAAEPPDQV